MAEDSMTEYRIALLEELIRGIRQQYEAAGIALAIVNGQGETCYQNFFGYRDEERQLPIDADTIFGLASVTKSFVALSILQLEERGLLDTEDPVSRYLPEFTNANQETVRICHFLSHSAGFYPVHRTTVREVMGEVPASCEAAEDLTYSEEMALKGTRIVAAQLNAQTGEHGLIGKPGLYMSYCNDGFGLLSEIVRRVSGEASFADYVRKNILEPLGMSRSGADYVRPSVDPDAVTLYKHVDGGRISLMDYYDRAFVLPGAGAMKSTLADMKKYLTMYLQRGRAGDGKPILSGEEIRRLTTPRIEYRPGSFYAYGLSVKQMEDLTVVEHGGSLTGISSHIAWSYDADCGVIVLCNTTGVPVSEIADAAMRLYHGLEVRPRREEGAEHPWSASLQKTAAGHYRSEEGDEVMISFPDGRLQLEINGRKVTAFMRNAQTALIRTPYKDNPLKLFLNEEGQVFAVGFGGRMLPRVSG